MPTYPEILVVGNYCHDTLINARGTFEVLGGSASYISSALWALDVPFDVVAKVGADFRYGKDVRVAPRVSATHPTTHFVDDTTSGSRQSVLRARCEPITPADLGERRSRVCVLSGVAFEVTPELLEHVRATCNVVICDAQGLLRSTDSQGRVLNIRMSETPFGGLLDRIDFLKVSEDESRCIDFGALPKGLTILRTLGPRGCELVRDGKSRHFPAPQVSEVDPTGAGDCFVAGFAEALAAGQPVETAALQGNRFGAHAVGQIGVPLRWPSNCTRPRE